ncbi:MAG: Glycosyl transferases group 1 [Chloroflexi bacterium ADurb.Bin360]|nr:MAG: Glycosyl transferases group 1 [Chloroflexi bacterium ADurb.Bin360]
MAHILIAYKQFPALGVGHAGGESVYRLIEALHGRGHRLTLVVRIQETERQFLPALEALCEQVVTVPHHRSLPGPRPLALLRSYLALRRATQRTLHEASPDFFHVEFAQTGAVVLGLRGVPTSIRAHDVNWFLMEQQAAQQAGTARVRSRALRALFLVLEPWLYRQFDLVAAISEGDRRLLVERRASKSVLLLPLAPAFNPAGAGEAAAVRGANVLFVGAMSRAYNIQAVLWFLDTIWTSVVQAVPEARFYVVGSNPSEAVLARHDGQHVFVTGFVPDLAPWYQAANVVVAPLQVAGGLLQKVVDAMGMGIPVIATTVSNHGLGATPGEHLWVADAPGPFADAVIRVLRHPEEGARLGQAGRRFVVSHYDPEIVIPQWEAALLNLQAGTK